MVGKAFQVSIVTFDENNAIDSVSWELHGDNLESLTDFVRYNLDEDQKQKLQLEDENGNILQTVLAKEEDKVLRCIRKWKKEHKS